MLVTKSVFKLIFVLSNYQTCNTPLTQLFSFLDPYVYIPQSHYGYCNIINTGLAIADVYELHQF